MFHREDTYVTHPSAQVLPQSPALPQTEMFQSFKVKSYCLDSLSGKDNDNASKQCANILRMVEFQGGLSLNGGLSVSSSMLPSASKRWNGLKRVDDGKTLETNDFMLDIFLSIHVH